MPVALYMDHHVQREITRALRARGIDILTAEDDGAAQFDDSELLNRAGELGRVLFTRDEDLLAEAALRKRAGVAFAGVIYAHMRRVDIGRCIQDLEIIAKSAEPEDFRGWVEFLPL